MRIREDAHLLHSDMSSCLSETGSTGVEPLDESTLDPDLVGYRSTTLSTDRMSELQS